MPGPRVRHSRWGEGVVIGDPAAPRPTVDFGYMKETVSRESLSWHDRPEYDTAAQRNEGTVVPMEEASALPEEAVRARRAILALKLGQVLEEDVEHLSVGIDAIQSRLQRAVDAAAQRRPQSVLIEGAWGTGKTHLLTLLTSLARRQGFCTAHVILDGEGVTLSEPMGLMEGILASIRYPGEELPSGIGDRLRESRRQHDYRELRQRLGWRLAQAMRQLPAAALDDPEALEVLEDYLMLTLAKTRAQEKLRFFGYSVDLPAVKAWRVDERPDRFRKLLRSWAEFCVLTGATGLAVVFDEVDVEYAATLWDGQRQQRRRALLQALADSARWSVPLLLAFGSAPEAGAGGGSDSRVLAALRRAWGVHLRQPDAAADLSRWLPETTRIQAPQPDVRQTRELGRRLQALHGCAYPDSTNGTQDVSRQIERLAREHADGLSPTLREFVRGTIEILDVADCRPSRAAQ